MKSKVMSIDEANSDVSNVGSEPVILLEGASIMSLATSLGAMRNGFIDVTILGALEVDQKGNISSIACKKQRYLYLQKKSRT